jgi:hypothetical protein
MEGSRFGAFRRIPRHLLQCGCGRKTSMQAAPANCPAFCFYRNTVCWTRLNEYRTRCRAAERWVVLGSRPLSHSLVAPALKGIPRGPVKRAKAAPLQVPLLFFCALLRLCQDSQTSGPSRGSGRRSNTQSAFSSAIYATPSFANAIQTE